MGLIGDRMQTAHDRANRFAIILREHALKVFETIDLTLRSVVVSCKRHHGKNIDFEGSVGSTAQNAAAQRLGGAIFLSQPDGRTALTTRVFPAPAVGFSGRDYFSEQRERDRGFYIGRAYTGNQC